MFKITRKALPGLLVILVLLMSAWTTPQTFWGGSGEGPGGGGQGGEQSDAPSSVNAADVVTTKGDPKLDTSLGQVAGVQERIDAVGAVSIDVSGVTSATVTEFDTAYVKASITGNTLELWSLLYALPKVRNNVVYDLLQMMIAQHTHHQQAMLAVAQQLGMDTTAVDFTNVAVYPETPTHDLGVRTVNLKNMYLDYLVMRPNVSYDMVVLHLLHGQHVDSLETAMAAERLVTNPALKAMAKHEADVAMLHIKLMDMVMRVHSLRFSQAPVPPFSAPYMSPMNITINGQSSTDQGGNNGNDGGQIGGGQTGQPATP